MNRLHLLLAIIAACTAAAAGVVDRSPIDRGALVHSGASSDAPTFISAPDLAERLMRGDSDLRVFDLRPREAYDDFHLPGARPATAERLVDEPLAPTTSVVLYADTRAAIGDAIRVLDRRNHRNVLVLREGLYEWLSRVQEPRLAVDATPSERTEFARAAEMSRFFGGVPRSGVTRDEVPTGYWTGTPRANELLMAAAVKSVAAIRRRGC
jgi:rhodanese-related sulfurtransferase